MDTDSPVSPFECFAGLDAQPEFAHRLVLRHPRISVEGSREEVVERLLPSHLAHVAEMGFEPAQLCIAEQVHGAEVATVEAPSTSVWTGMDGFVSRSSNVLLGIYVADCCAVFLTDPVSGVFGLVHSGRKGSEQGIVVNAIWAMERLGSRPNDIHVTLSPCIRPPAYEIDFAELIVGGCLEQGVPESQIHDDGTCTSSDLERYYSYRIEKGCTGRMLALLGRSGGACA